MMPSAFGALCLRFDFVAPISYSIESQLKPNSHKLLLHAKLTQKLFPFRKIDITYEDSHVFGSARLMA